MPRLTIMLSLMVFDQTLTNMPRAPRAGARMLPMRAPRATAWPKISSPCAST